MKRFLSWVVLFLLSDVLFALIEVALKLVLWVVAKMSIGEVLFWIVLIGGGGGVLSAVLYGAFAGAAGITELTERICPSKKGARYFVFGTVFVIWYIWQIVRFIGSVSGIVLAVQIVAAVVCIIASIVIFAAGYKNRETA